MATNHNNKNSEIGKQLLNSGNQDLEQMTLGLEKLRNLSKDDRTEAGMLRSRIDEQSQLIMMLKNRSDENLRRVQVLERMKIDMEMCAHKSNDELRLETKRSEMLDKRFTELATNHEEMIKIKDEYKTANVSLKHENARLKQENEKLFCRAIADRDQCIKDLESKSKTLEEQCHALDEKLRLSMSKSQQREKMLEEKLENTESLSNTRRKELQRQLSQTERQLKDALSRLDGELSQQTQSDQRFKQLTHEKDELLDLAMHRGKLIQEKQNENKNLSRNIDDLKASVRSLEDRFEKEASTVNTNKAVILLREGLDSAEKRYQKVLNEYEAYKSHTNHLLSQERKLNEKLRHLAG